MLPNEDDFENIDAFLRATEGKRIDFLTWVRDAINPRIFLYAGSGFDQLPKTILGEEVVIHLSYEETDRPYEKGYLFFLGSGRKLGANFLQTPLKDQSVDAVYIHDSPVHVTTLALGEFYRVLKSVGHLILDNGGWHDIEVDYFLETALALFTNIPIPKCFWDPYNAYRAFVYVFSGNGPHFGLTKTLRRTEQVLAAMPWLDRQSVTTQCFKVLEKP